MRQKAHKEPQNHCPAGDRSHKAQMGLGYQPGGQGSGHLILNCFHCYTSSSMVTGGQSLLYTSSGIDARPAQERDLRGPRRRFSTDAVRQAPGANTRTAASSPFQEPVRLCTGFNLPQSNQWEGPSWSVHTSKGGRHRPDRNQPTLGGMIKDQFGKIIGPEILEDNVSVGCEGI